MQNRIAIGCILGVVLAVSLTAASSVSQMIEYHGVLNDAAGKPVPDGNYSITFRIWDDSIAGNVRWTEGRLVEVTKGHYDLLLGAVVPLPDLATDSAQCWLGVQLGLRKEDSPRCRLLVLERQLAHTDSTRDVTSDRSASVGSSRPTTPAPDLRSRSESTSPIPAADDRASHEFRGLSRMHRPFPFQLGGGFTFYYHKYEEPGLMTEKGYAAVDQLHLGLRTEKFVAMLEGSIHFPWYLLIPPKNTYDGHIMHVDELVPYRVKGVRNDVWYLSCQAGLVVPLSSKTSLLIYGGSGLRWLNDYLSVDTLGYDRRSRYLFGLVRLELESSIIQHSLLDYHCLLLCAEYDYLLDGTQMSELSDIRGGGVAFTDVTNKQYSGYGLYLAAGLRRVCQSTWKRGEGDIVAFVRIWSIGDSEMTFTRATERRPGGQQADLLIVEPRNRTIEIGLRMSFHFVL